jgi:hypothetical protein
MPECESAGRRQHSKTVSRLSPTYAPTGMDQFLSDLAGQAPEARPGGQNPLHPRALSGTKASEIGGTARMLAFVPAPRLLPPAEE